MNKQQIIERFLRGVLTWEEGENMFKELGLTPMDWHNAVVIAADIRQQADLPPDRIDYKNLPE